MELCLQTHGLAVPSGRTLLVLRKTRASLLDLFSPPFALRLKKYAIFLCAVRIVRGPARDRGRKLKGVIGNVSFFALSQSAATRSRQIGSFSKEIVHDLVVTKVCWVFVKIAGRKKGNVCLCLFRFRQRASKDKRSSKIAGRCFYNRNLG